MTLLDSDYRCCLVDDAGNQCRRRGAHLILRPGQHTRACAEHLADARQEGDEVRPLFTIGPRGGLYSWWTEGGPTMFRKARG